MGHSHTYHLIGIAPDPAQKTREYVYPCMSLTDAAQSIHKAKSRGESIKQWYAQTRTGERMLGPDYDGVSITTSRLRARLPRLVTCPVCTGKHCYVCNFSGICKPGHWRKWQRWQIERTTAALGVDFSPLAADRYYGE